MRAEKARTAPEKELVEGLFSGGERAWFAYARHGVPCLELARAELRPTPAPPVPTAEEVAEAAAAEAAEAAWEEARAARQMEADLRLSREWLLGLDDDCVDDDYR